MKENNVIKTKSYEFALIIIALYKEFQNEKEYVLSKQLLRSGTSIGANVTEASAAQSKKDFIAKLSIASKEARETLYWLSLIKDSKLTSVNVEEQINRCHELVKLLTSILKTLQAEPIKN